MAWWRRERVLRPYPWPTEYDCDCGDLRMRFKIDGRYVYLCHTCDRDHPVIAYRLARSEVVKAMQEASADAHVGE